MRFFTSASSGSAWRESLGRHTERSEVSPYSEIFHPRTSDSRWRYTNRHSFSEHFKMLGTQIDFEDQVSNLTSQVLSLISYFS